MTCQNSVKFGQVLNMSCQVSTLCRDESLLCPHTGYDGMDMSFLGDPEEEMLF